MSLTLHEHPFASYCWKALIALAELDMPFERRSVNDEADRDALAALWPMASIPVLVDSRAGIALPEETVIIEYLDLSAGGGKLIPSDAVEALGVRLWDRVFDNYVMTPMQKIVLDSLRDESDRDTTGVAGARQELEQAYEMLEQRLTGSAWAAGEAFTLADCAAAPSLFYARVVHRWDEDRLEKLTTYYRRLEARPSVAGVIDEARPFREVFPLPWPSYVD